jgi:hypothetical protein
MRTPVSTGGGREAAHRARLALLAELREVDHWLRLVAARIDLAVAAVAAIDEPVVRSLPTAPAVPFGLRELLGLAPPGLARGEADVLLRLRVVQRDLDAYARALRASAAGLGDEAADPGASGDGADVVVLADRRHRHRRSGPLVDPA